MDARLALLAPLALACGCSTVGGSAIRTGPVRLPPHYGDVSIFASTRPAEGTELGVVEVHASQTEANVETLVPLFVEKVAALGGNAAVIDRVQGGFQWLPQAVTETYEYACGFRAVCIGTRTVYTSQEVFALSIAGRAFAVGGAPRAVPR